ncbi:MAG: hypothetical protein SPE89_04575, partial [Fusicatenibacter saccharivorans]|nr:hypothetical protein [Fusicatenibacter saccharivorans]
ADPGRSILGCFRAKHRKQYKIKCRCKSPKTAYSEKGQLFIKVVNWCKNLITIFLFLCYTYAKIPDTLLHRPGSPCIEKK